jgi:hypothetical protein
MSTAFGMGPQPEAFISPGAAAVKWLWVCLPNPARTAPIADGPWPITTRDVLTAHLVPESRNDSTMASSELQITAPG